MYYITNQNHQVIAADTELLKQLDIDNVEELFKKTALEELTFTSLSSQELTITSGIDEYVFKTESVALSGMLGEMTLHILSSSDQVEAADDVSAVPDDETTESFEDFLTLEDEEEPISFIESEEEAVETAQDEMPDLEPISIVEDEKAEEELIGIIEDEEPLDLFEEETITHEEEPVSVVAEEDESVTPEEPKAEEKKEEMSMAPITIDVASVSQIIGITTDEYSDFLNEFIDTAISLEKELKSDNEETQSTAIQTLVKLSEVLHIPEISHSAQKIGDCSSEEHDNCIEILYNKLARLTTQQSFTPSSESIEEIEPMIEPMIEPELELEDEMLIAPEMEVDEEPKIELEMEEETEELPEGSFGTLELDDVKPVHFDFRLEEAADELSLPVELIDEFVHDFIDQANSETTKMLQAYKEGDLDQIQQIGHLLKGASSNLRINPLADTLYEIQFCEDSSKLEALIKNYWAHFIAFEKQMEMTSK